MLIMQEENPFETKEGAQLWIQSVENEKGEMEIIILKSGDVLENKPGRKHRVTPIEDVRIIEVSTPELNDVVRIEDDYKR